MNIILPSLYKGRDNCILALIGQLHGVCASVFSHATIDPVKLAFPVQPFAEALPRRVVSPGTPIGNVTPAASARTGLPISCLVCAGTTGRYVRKLSNVCGAKDSESEIKNHALTSLVQA